MTTETFAPTETTNPEVQVLDKSDLAGKLVDALSTNPKTKEFPKLTNGNIVSSVKTLDTLSYVITSTVVTDEQGNKTQVDSVRPKIAQAELDVNDEGEKDFDDPVTRHRSYDVETIRMEQFFNIRIQDNEKPSTSDLVMDPSHPNFSSDDWNEAVMNATREAETR